MTKARPQSITRIATDHGLSRSEVRTLVIVNGVPTYRLAQARVVAPDDLPRLREIILQYREAKLVHDQVALAL